MTEDEALFAHASDLKMQCEDEATVQSTAFLDPRQRTLLLPLEKSQSEFVRTFYYGGYDGAERLCAVFVPRFFEQDNAQDFFRSFPEYCPFSLLRLEKDRFSELSHRDYLGALMALGLRRETLGDIITDNGGCFLFCLSSVKRFILENLKSAGRASITVNEAGTDAFLQKNERTQDVFFSVASLRLDAVCGCAFSLSRAKAAQFIESGLVFVNGVQVTKSDKKLSAGDKIVLRKKGKAVLLEVKGESKKGRTHITVRKYL